MAGQAAPSRFVDRLRNAGIEPGDSDELRLNKALLVFATGLVSVASTLWLAIYWSLGPQLSATLPFAFQILLAGNLLVYLKTGNFNFFRIAQLGLFLFFPFVAQWSIGNFITASGLILWGLLAPIGAILCFGVRESIAWFFAYVFLVALTGFFDYYLADAVPVSAATRIPIRTSVFFFALNFVAISSMVYLLLRFSIQEKQKIESKLAEAHRLLQIEQDRSERLLLNILPGPIAERLKNSNQTIADGFADVTVMFADIVNFTQVASGMTPSQVFAMLNRIFSVWDELAEKYGIEKIKTIGDAYMVAGGLNDAREDYSAAIADLALEMRDLLHRDFNVNDRHLDVRIGIGTGPVVAGVVGKKKFIYDLWGDTVNIASRITTEGTPGMVQCDAATWRRLKGNFVFDEPQVLYLKGKGNMTVYRLQGRNQQATPGAARAVAVGMR
ncbi:MAG TPA: adenylate/guanylate cyclase domain-containing protein [Rhodocyclaceae bacterium]|nr:adenylate/guanylate cyclase domain-containing protein [Rhodocyclaceae bacterium]HMV53320.1 adenylate/guanylate cyclase domain-containing protein [Rhodocyclaceae bacterium]HMZ82995.1 adenylate/guanylate cyclase domain-containing protein [Rhodocyclaceae bacterium]HNB78463.1 adenylate/guanylate cyclase domain-containing protein [Rhodocyclaceae bacterium]HNC60859.1 adenylate/guanylate cyclase domain-containing protein [Rhodocyclaceae bacterium]